jgi:transcriptional regulator GlxA family with amidase domain
MMMSLSTLRRKLKAVVDRTPARVIWDARLKIGAHLLETSTLTITKIAFEVGFTDSNHFGRLFKQNFGETPSKYRERSKDQISD